MKLTSLNIYTRGLTKYKEQCMAIGTKHKLNKNGQAYLKGIRDEFNLSIKYLNKVQKEMQKNEEDENQNHRNS